MSCRHDLANRSCKRCYPETGTIDPGPESNFLANLEGPGAMGPVSGASMERIHDSLLGATCAVGPSAISRAEQLGARILAAPDRPRRATLKEEPKETARTIQDLIGQTISHIKGATKGSDSVDFMLTDGRRFRMYHEQDDSETVLLEDVCGDVGDLIGSQVVRAEEASSDEPLPDGKEIDPWESFTWTFYIIGTSHGTVTFRWLGTSDGYYSERVDFVEIEKK